MARQILAQKYPLSVSLVMPVYNEAELIESVVAKYYAVISKLPDWEFIIAEDGSTDGTKRILSQLKNKYPKLTIHSGSRRVGAAQGQRNCINAARKDLIWYSDSDNQHEPRDFFKLYRKLVNDHLDMVIGNKTKRQDPLYRLYLSWVFNIMIATIYGFYSSDINCGFRLFSQKLRNQILPQTTIFPGFVLTEFTLRAHHAHFSIGQLPVTHYARKGQSRAIKPSKLIPLVISTLKAMVILKKQLLFSHPL